MNKKGFTLIETAVSLAILGIMSVMVAGIFGAASVKTAENMRTGKQRELVLGRIETVIASGLNDASPELERKNGGIAIDFNGNKINADGVYLTGFYGDDKLPARYFYAR